MLDLRYVKKLIEMLEGSSVDSVEISSEKGLKIRIAKTPTQRGAVQIQAPVPVAAVLPAVGVGRATPTEAMPAIGEPEAAPRPAPVAAAPSTLAEVKSPMVGTFYSAPEPGAKAYVTVGSRVSKGQVLCIIEAMKIMNEIESEVSGVVREILVDDAHPVEYGQVLFRVDANG